MSGTIGKVLVLFIIPLVLYVILLPFMPLMEPDESRYSLIPRSMNKSGDYVTPRLKEAVYIEKPPLAYWVTALFFKIFGENEFSSRLFAGLCAWACILLVYRIGTAFQDYHTGLYGAAVLTISLFHFAIGRINILDMPVAFFMSLSLWAGYRYYADTDNKRWIYLFYLSSALAFLTKGLIGIVLPGAIILIWLFSVKRWRETYKLLSPTGIVIFLAVSLPWIFLIQKSHPDFFRFFFIQEHFQRYATTIDQHAGPLYFYVPVIIAGTLPWSVFLIKALQGKGWGRIKDKLFRKEETVFLLVWIGFITLFFSFSSSKLIPYIASIFLPLSLFGGRVFHLYDEQNYVRKKTGGNWFITVYIVSALFLAVTVFPLSNFMAQRKSAYLLTQAIKRYVPAGHELYQYGMSLYGIDFYGKMRTPIVDDIGEVYYGSQFLPVAERSHYFLNSEEFFKLAGRQEVVYCATKGQERLDRLRKEVPHLTVLWDNKHYYLVRLENSKGSQ